MKTYIKKIAILALLTIIIFYSDIANGAVTSNNREPAVTLHSFTRSINFDPHPTLIEPLGNSPLSLGNQKVNYALELIETWETESKQPFLKKIGFKLILNRDSSKEIVEIPSQELNVKKINKNKTFANCRHGDLGIEVQIDNFKANQNKITEITLSFYLKKYGNSSSESTQNTQLDNTINQDSKQNLSSTQDNTDTSTLSTNKNTGGNLVLARQFLTKAEALPQDKSEIKRSLLKKALLAIPENSSTPEVLELKAKIEAALNDLQTEQTNHSPVSMSNSANFSQKIQDSLQKVQQLLAQNEEVQARELLRKIIEEEPKCYPAWQLLAQNAFKNSKYAKAIEAAEKAISIKEDDLDSAVIFFKSCYYTGQGEKGLEKLLAMTAKFPSKLDVKQALAEAYFQLGDLPACEAECLKILQIAPSNIMASNLLKKVREKMK